MALLQDGLAVASTSSETKPEKMVSPNTNSAARKIILEEKKRHIEEKLAKCNQELKALCIQEAELTGITPPEMPLEIGETPPTIRRKIGTAFQFNESLLTFNDTNKDRQKITDLELEIQLHMKMMDAALGLANEGNISKTVKRQHRAQYQKHKEQLRILEEELAILKEKAASELLKPKKKSRVSESQDDNMSVMTLEAYSLKQEHRHSQLSNKSSTSMLSPTDTYPEARYPSTSKQYRNSENPQFDYSRSEDLSSGFYRLSVNGYNDYIDRQEAYCYQSRFGYNYPHPYNQAIHSPSSVSQSPQISQHSPHVLQGNQYLPHYSQHSPISQHSPVSQHSPQARREVLHLSHSPVSQHSLTIQRMSQQYPQVLQSSPTGNQGNVQYYPTHTIYGEPMYNRSVMEASGYRNTVDASSFPTSIQPHQQYENNGMNSGLGGCWKKSESGQMHWVYSSNTLDGSWQRDKRFGSLDRRKNKRIQRKISPVDSKSATLAIVPTHSDQSQATFVKPSQVTNRRSQDHRQLVRTQSLGSVGQTIDSVYPSDDTSSCESDSRSFKDIRAVRKQKEKEWLETSLDGPISPTHSVISSSHSIVSANLASEDKYLTRTPPPPPLPQHSPSMPLHSQNFPSHLMHHIPHHLPNIHPPPVQSPLSIKPSLEIPAESRPSPRVAPEVPNMELLNNNIPKNCTVVQAGIVKPYHEESKPFEMSDFYKYSTKFNKSPQKETGKGVSGGLASQRNLSEGFQEEVNHRYPAKMQFLHHRDSTTSTTKSNLNNSLDLTQITVSEHFSEEMNAWYQDRESLENNNPRAENRSGATLV
ncbi:uncharacterized protein sstn [Euwallacea fornicatus]|uniref:uncharacterized protein sstn n=1 Tax=Euwallacea fornicatus TaxID=995702 RepID=UPI00338E15EE